jgi:acetoin utilization deacetylase AcuC-like enzyme
MTNPAPGESTGTTPTLPVSFDPSYAVPDATRERASDWSVTLDTITKSAEVARLIGEHLSERVRLVSARPATPETLALVHDPTYIARILTGKAEIVPSLLASTGGVLDAVDAALGSGYAGSLSSGIHHARRDSEAGYCHFNALALACHHAIDHHGLRRVGVLDVDTHCGGGTFSLVGKRPEVWIADVSMQAFDSWSSDSDRHHLVVVSEPDQYLKEVERALDHLTGVDFVLVNAGVDVHEKAGTPRGIDTETLMRREEIIGEWLRSIDIRAAFVLAGGYSGSDFTIADVAQLHLGIVRAFADLVSR